MTIIGWVSQALDFQLPNPFYARELASQRAADPGETVRAAPDNAPAEENLALTSWLILA